MTVTLAVIGAGMALLGVHPLVAVGVALLSIWPPVGVAAAVGIAVWGTFQRFRNRTEPSEASFLNGVAAAVSAGSTIRQALMVADPSYVDVTVRRLCSLGRPMVDVAAALAPRLPSTGRELRVLLELSETSGSRIVPALHQLAEHAAEMEQRDQERRVAVAQAKFSSVVVGVVPLAVAVLVVVIRGVPEPGGPFVVVPMVVGACAMVAGGGLVFFLANKAAT